MLSATSELKCPHKLYEEEKLQWLVQQIKEAVMSWSEERIGIANSERDVGNDLENSAVKIQEKAIFFLENCLQLISSKELWEKEKDIAKHCSELINKVERLNIPPMCCDVLKTTDAGPGVGVTNIEVRF